MISRRHRPNQSNLTLEPSTTERLAAALGKAPLPSPRLTSPEGAISLNLLYEKQGLNR